MKKDALVPVTIPEPQAEDKLKFYALVELFGRQRLVGMVVVDPPEFPGLIRVDVPDLLKDGKVVRKGFTRYLGRTALYGVTPITEQMVRELLPSIDGRPSEPMGLRDGYRDEEY